MSFLAGGGADCGPVNPLQSLLKHSERDASTQHDRFTQMPGGQQQQQQHGGMRTNHQGPVMDAVDAQRFFGGAAASGSPFAMEAMKHELARWQHQQQQQQRAGTPTGSSREGSHTPAMVSDWAKQFSANGHNMQQSYDTSQQAEAWRASFLSSPLQASSSTAAPPLAASSGPMTYSQPYQTYQPTFQMPVYGGGPAFAAAPMGGGSQFMQSTPAQAAMDPKGKSRFVELDDKAWEEQFAKLDQPTGKATDKGSETAQMPAAFQDNEATVQEDAAALKEAQEQEETDDEFVKNLEKTWRNLKYTLDESAHTDAEYAAWESQYGTNFADLHDGFDEDTSTGSHLGLDAKTFDEWLQQATSQDFPFEQAADNPFVDTFDPFAEGNRLLREGHPLSEAALAFEAACRQNPHRGEAWRALGDTLAADEKEVKAIRALERAVSCPDGGGEGAWMSLAISYVNEGQDLRAFATLEKWITTAYPSIAEQVNASSSQKTAEQNSPWSISSRVVDMFLAAARSGPAARTSHQDGQMVDADVQSGLGVLFYTNSDYARARDCFEAALGVRPDDFLLWNRLGATLANGGQPEEAIEAYRKALELRPTFTRAIYNLGVSCLNINCYREAAEHLLAALDLHRRDKLVSGKGKGRETDDEALEPADGSDNLWHTLRRAFLCMERPDLADRARPGGDVASFRREGFEF